jgi:hypothetical protein
MNHTPSANDDRMAHLPCMVVITFTGGFAIVGAAHQHLAALN